MKEKTRMRIRHNLRQFIRGSTASGRAAFFCFSLRRAAARPDAVLA